MADKDDEKVPAHKARPVIKKRRKNKPKDFPKRPLSAYNIFFKETRETILTMKEEDKEGSADFQSMVKEIASRWRTLAAEGRERVDSLAKKDLLRYKEEVTAYEEKMVKKSRREREESIQTEHKKQHEADSNSRTSSNSQRSATERQIQNGQLERNDPQGGFDMQALLSKELKALGVIRESRLRQLQLVQQLQAGAPHQSQVLLENLEAQRRIVGLPPLSAESHELGSIRRQPSLVPSFASHNGASLGDLSGGLLSQISSLPSLSASSPYAREEALLRNYARHQQEQELLAHRQELSQLNRGALDSMGGERTLAGLSALRGGSMYPPSDSRLLSSLQGLSGLRHRQGG
jgi:hypothetical protein